MDAAIDQSNQRALPRSIRAEDGGVLAEVQGQTEVVEHTTGLQPGFNRFEFEPGLPRISH